MDIDKAIEILKQHNEWRRCNDLFSTKKMVNPKELGIAIDVVIEELTNKNKKNETNI